MLKSEKGDWTAGRLDPEARQRRCPRLLARARRRPVQGPRIATHGVHQGCRKGARFSGAHGCSLGVTRRQTPASTTYTWPCFSPGPAFGHFRAYSRFHPASAFVGKGGMLLQARANGAGPQETLSLDSNRCSLVASEQGCTGRYSLPEPPSPRSPGPPGTDDTQLPPRCPSGGRKAASWGCFGSGHIPAPGFSGRLEGKRAVVPHGPPSMK